MSDTPPEPAAIIRAVMLSHGHVDWTDIDADNMTENVIGALRDAGYSFMRPVSEAEERENAEMWP